MPIIPKVGRKSAKTRLLITGIYVVLILGAITMVYPFVLMLSTSITSSTDTNEFRAVPRYLSELQPLFAKYVDEKYGGDLDQINARYHTAFTRAEQVAPPSSVEGRADEWVAFVKTLPLKFKEAGFRGYGLHPSPLARRYREHLRKLFSGDITALNRAYIEENESFESVRPPIERMGKRNWSPDPGRKMQDFQAWKAGLPQQMLMVAGADLLFANYLREDVEEYGGDIRKAQQWSKAGSFDRVTLSTAPPQDPAQRADWERFVRTKLPFRYIAPTSAARPYYQALLKSRYATLAKLNLRYGTRYASFDEAAMPTTLPDGGPIVVDWGDFIAKVVPIAALRVDSPETRWREQHSDQPHPPYLLTDAVFVEANAGALRKDYAVRNYSLVYDYLVVHGRAVLVTVLFCLAVIATTLVVNPLCAYALSRYGLPYSYKVLLFLLATMAFPAEVAMIPNFLMLKDLGFLNTYWALVLPGMASGFSIFLLKGFFDSLPKEIYEAGTIDGASDSRMFWKITLPLSKPIFAVIALQAFTGAYGAFMFAFVVCQNPKMWTIMVWLYELQISSPQYIVMAALAVAALPTLIVFTLCQNVIMRGIILPSYK